MDSILKIEIGKRYDDMVCVGSSKDYTYNKSGKLISVRNVYLMECNICGRKKNMLSSTIRMHKGTSHKSCGKGLKTLSHHFHDRWAAMRTRTTNPNYSHADRYSKRGINSDEFELFIDFYDAMFASFEKLANKIGPENTSLERIDINKSYTKENCIWIDKRDQPKNTCRTVYFEVTYPDGTVEKHNRLGDFCRANGICYDSALDCMNGKINFAKGFKFKRIDKSEFDKV